MYTLGINAAFHDSSACLVRDGRVVAAAEEERFTRIKHAKRPIPFTAYELPYHAINFCLQRAGIELADLDHVAYAYDPQQLLRGRAGGITLAFEPSAQPLEGWDSPWEPLFVSYILNAPRQLVDGAPHHLRARFRKREPMRYRWHFVDHHLAHEASAFLPSPFETAAVMTLDGRGERVTTSYAIGQGNRLTRIGQVEFPHSLGLLYEDVTRHLGFLNSSDEYKVMALACFGEPKYLVDFRECFGLDGGGRYRVAASDLIRRLGPARARGEPLTQRHFDIARSLQQLLEETALDLARWLHSETGLDDLCLAGGVALNCAMNGRLLRESPFRRIWVQPAAGDAGTALGAAMHVDAQVRNDDRRCYAMQDVFLGPQYADAEIEEFLKYTKLKFRRIGGMDEVAALLAEDRVIGWFQGGMEFGPRALGARSILASPMSPDMQARLNELKDREDFRPVAPVVLQEEASRWFAGCDDSPFMLFTYPVLSAQRRRIPAVVHVDGTARVQTINRAQNARYYDLIKAFQARTGVPVLVNTSFNTRGQPIVCTPRDAVESFASTPLDALVIGPFLLEKHEIAYDRTGIGRRSDVQTPVPA
ncbi:MAG: carbamoyltransferase [Sulfurifustis sp.]